MLTDTLIVHLLNLVSGDRNRICRLLYPQQGICFSLLDTGWFIWAVLATLRYHYFNVSLLPDIAKFVLLISFVALFSEINAPVSYHPHNVWSSVFPSSLSFGCRITEKLAMHPYIIILRWEIIKIKVHSDFSIQIASSLVNFFAHFPHLNPHDTLYPSAAVDQNKPFAT